MLLLRSHGKNERVVRRRSKEIGLETIGSEAGRLHEPVSEGMKVTLKRRISEKDTENRETRRAASGIKPLPCRTASHFSTYLIFISFFPTPLPQRRCNSWSCRSKRHLSARRCSPPHADRWHAQRTHTTDGMADVHVSCKGKDNTWKLPALLW